ncbi:endoplasmic reticulum oxidoreductin-2 [Selaginella moellendorffii]|nr:endoplasmic reticulum oxidoreductin-2 [Selaginella moellendorffii]|eukprot:XP_002974086.2 endoplasmic reticulum oxidoreductin-2 [Selaginella moellendorffii]
MGSAENGQDHHEELEARGKKRRKGLRRRLWSWAVLAALVAIFAMSVTGTSPSFFNYRAYFPCPWPHHNSQKLSGVVEDCQCDYKTVDTINEEVVFPALQSLVKKPFFRYFKVKLWCDCPFWPDDGMCHLRDCSVCECPENEFPETFKRPSGQLSPADPKCQEGKPQATVDRTLDNQAFHGWTEADNPWTYDNETDNAEMTYVNLVLNPERYTGYIGASAHRIWDTIYKMNCFKDAHKDVCTERRILYKLISGLHSSISVHIASDYLLDESTNHWGPNYTLLHERVVQYPDRVKNLYFVYLFVLRAVNKASAFLAQAEYSTGNTIEDATTQLLIKDLVTSQRLLNLCPVPFDEAQLRSVDGGELKSHIQEHFRKISALMDCVGCEKCRLWGKLQTLGLGTALKILFSEETPHSLNLQRNEVIALINLLSRLSESLKFVNDSLLQNKVKGLGSRDM